MRPIKSTFCIGILLFSLCATAHAFDISSIEELTGDKKLACEAILCLSSSARPSECSPSLDRYYDIKKDKWKDTRKARKNFLNLCPASSETGMPSLIDAISDGAGYCDAAQLNKNITYAYRTYNHNTRQYGTWKDGYPEGYSECKNSSSNYGGEDTYYAPVCVEIKQVIDNNLPSRCLNLFNNELTYYEPLKYVGNKYEGGKWVQE